MNKLILDDNFISWKEAAAILGVSMQPFYTMVKKYNISKIKIFQYVYYKKDEITKLKEQLDYPNKDELLKPSQAWRMLGITDTTFYSKVVKNYKLTKIRLKGRVYYKKDEIEGVIDKILKGC